MSLTNTNREARRKVRSVGLRDLRFAGTVAAGLVAGVLGVGALSAPLLGWTTWPDRLQPGADSPVTMRSPVQRPAIAQPPSSGTHTTPSGPSGVPVLGAGTALVIAPRTGSTTTTTATGTTGNGGSGSTPAPRGTTVGSTEQGNGSGTDFGGSGFVA